MMKEANACTLSWSHLESVTQIEVWSQAPESRKIVNNASKDQLKIIVLLRFENTYHNV